MEIRNSILSSQTLASVLRQREISGATANIGVSDSPRVNAEGSGKEHASPLFDPEDVRLALQTLEECRAYAERHTQRDPAVANSRTRRALSAYVAQQNLARDDVQSSLHQLLGVDYYA